MQRSYIAEASWIALFRLVQGSLHCSQTAIRKWDRCPSYCFVPLSEPLSYSVYRTPMSFALSPFAPSATRATQSSPAIACSGPGSCPGGFG
ncbi:hypothetical protein B0J13DRAFT_541855 [Dactylonectria estremocensis]|uniref:Secreted protein n=1 Tax=Dactylonectria estremocensis TaxID=1079267 RepID=A0A9P9FB51_9HYPO|nr:hypothetical protein B0J13DRAFT_541855 [Dactylonectria estremocensis]